MCHICKRRIEHGNELRGDDCQNLYHESSIPRHHKDRIPYSEDDTYLSHLLQRRNVNNSTDEMLQNIDYDNDISELHVLATQKEICKSVCRSIVL